MVFGVGAEHVLVLRWPTRARRRARRRRTGLGDRGRPWRRDDACTPRRGIESRADADPFARPRFELAIYRALGRDDARRARREADRQRRGLRRSLRRDSSRDLERHVDIFILQKSKALDRILTAIAQRTSGVATTTFARASRSPLRSAAWQKDELARSHRKIIVIDGVDARSRERHRPRAATHHSRCRSATRSTLDVSRDGYLMARPSWRSRRRNREADGDLREGELERIEPEVRSDRG